MITGTVVLTVSADDDRADRRVAGHLYGLPPGVRVVLNVGDRCTWSPYLVDQLRQFTEVVHIDVHGSTDAVSAWVRAIRGEEIVRLGWTA